MECVFISISKPGLSFFSAHILGAATGKHIVFSLQICSMVSCYEKILTSTIQYNSYSNYYSVMSPKVVVVPQSQGCWECFVMLVAQPGTGQSLRMWWGLGTGGGCALPSDDKDHGNSGSIMKSKKQTFIISSYGQRVFSFAGASVWRLLPVTT